MTNTTEHIQSIRKALVRIEEQMEADEYAGIQGELREQISELDFDIWELTETSGRRFSKEKSSDEKILDEMENTCGRKYYG